MKLTILFGALVAFSSFKTTQGLLKCHHCEYIKVDGGKVIGERDCKSGGKSLPLLECNRAEANMKQACSSTEVDSEVGGVRYQMTTRSCGSTLDDKERCQKGVSDIGSELPEELEFPSGIETNFCVCFTDGCNSAAINKFTSSAPLIMLLAGLVSIYILTST